MRNDDQKTSLILCACGILPVVWLALLTAPYVSGGLVEIIRGLPVAMGNPFEITMCEDSVKTVLKVDRLTLQIALMKIQGYSTREIAVYLDITEKAVYRRMDRLKEKLKKFFE